MANGSMERCRPQQLNALDAPCGPGLAEQSMGAQLHRQRQASGKKGQIHLFSKTF
jgi:hypothetical protein